MEEQNLPIPQNFNNSITPNVVYPNRSPFSYLDTYFDTRTYRNGCPFFVLYVFLYPTIARAGFALTYLALWSLV